MAFLVGDSLVWHRFRDGFPGRCQWLVARGWKAVFVRDDDDVVLLLCCAR